MMRYAVEIEKAEFDRSARAPDLPGCVATGAEVERGKGEAIRRHLDGPRGDGVPGPEPTSVVPRVDA